jgi:hypothetical protein
VNGYTGDQCQNGPALQNIGSYTVHDGPAWGTNPQTYTCLEACALVFGGDKSEYECSTNSNSIDNLGWTSTWGGPCAQNAEDHKVNTFYNCGSHGCATSAYVTDHCGGAQTNYCWK